MIIDSHCHIPHESYYLPVKEIISNAKKNGVEKLILIGTSLENNESTLSVAGSYPESYCCLGIYPHEDLGREFDTLLDSLKEQVDKSSKVVGIGETGLDLGVYEGGRNAYEQVELFKLHILLAKEKNLPLSIHNRNGDNEVMELLKHSGNEVTGVFHCFTQDWEYAKKVLDLGFNISFTGIITYPKNFELREVVKKIPLDRFLIETDSPYLPPQQFRGKTNYPEYAKIVAETIAQVRSEGFEEIEEASYNNTCALFKIESTEG